MTAPTKVVRIRAYREADAPWDEASTREAERWGVFGTVVDQQPEPSTGYVLTDLEVTRNGYGALSGAVQARPGTSLEAAATADRGDRR